MLSLVSRLLLVLLTVVLLGLLVGLVVVWGQTQREHAAFVDRHQRMEKRLAVIREQRAEREAYLRAFLEDPEFVERVVRERLGYAAPGETIFRYENP
jgi:cell division protein FtsB